QIEGLPAGPTSLETVQRDWHVKFGRGASFPADLHADVVPPRQGDVLDQEPQHPLAVPRRGPRVIPHRREVACQPQDLLTGLRGEGDTARLFPPDQRLLRLGKGPEPLVPALLEGLGDEAVLRVDQEELALRQPRLVADALDLAAVEGTDLLV